jgi:membrane dipeptidase
VNRRQFLRTGLLASAGVLAGPMINLGRYSLFADEPKRYSARTIDLVGSSTVIDMLGLLTLDWPRLFSWQRNPTTYGEADIRKLRLSGVNVLHPAVETNEPDAYKGALRWISGWNRLLQGHTATMFRVDAAADFARVRDEGKVGLLVGFQNSEHFRRAEDVAFFHGLGQRVSQLTYNDRNRIGAGCHVPQAGLTPYGAEIVAAMNRAGMAIDISHCSERTTLDAVAASSKPVLITHSNCRALVPHPRCKSDAAIKAVAACGGVMGITAIAAFVSHRRPANVKDFLNHFDHVAKLVGVEHLGLGSDVDLDGLDPQTGRVRPRYAIQGLNHSRRVFDLTEGLLRRGYKDRHIELILGGNFQRALGEIWGPGAPPQPPAPTAAAPQPLAS